MQRFVIILVALVVAMSGFMLLRTFEFPKVGVKQDEDLKNWNSYSPPSKSFEVKFPAPVQHVAESMHDDDTSHVRRYNLYVSQDLDASIFTVTTITYVGEDNIGNEPEILEDTVNDILISNPNNQLLETKPETVNGSRAIEFTVQSGTNNLHGVTFVHEDMLYILTLLSNKEERNEDFSYFVDSFKANPK